MCTDLFPMPLLHPEIALQLRAASSAPNARAKSPATHRASRLQSHAAPPECAPSPSFAPAARRRSPRSFRRAVAPRADAPVRDLHRKAAHRSRRQNDLLPSKPSRHAEREKCEWTFARIVACPRRESNSHLRFRKPPVYPLNDVNERGFSICDRRLLSNRSPGSRRPFLCPNLSELHAEDSASHIQTAFSMRAKVRDCGTLSVRAGQA